MREQSSRRHQTTRRLIFLALITVIFLCAAILRFAGINWDQHQHVHPDERFIVWVADTLSWPDDLATALDPARSTINPFRWPPGETIVRLRSSRHNQTGVTPGPAFAAPASTQSTGWADENVGGGLMKMSGWADEDLSHFRCDFVSRWHLSPGERSGSKARERGEGWLVSGKLPPRSCRALSRG